MSIQHNILLSQFTNWRIGGPADYFVEIENLPGLREAVDFASKNKIPYEILGGGTNVLVSDKGYRGLIIKNRMNSIKIVAYKHRLSRDDVSRKNVYISADSGVLVNRLVRYTLDQGMSGLENFLGQPGSVGGAMYINAHNMRQNDFFGNHIVEATIFTRAGESKTVPVSYFDFGYDKSSIQDNKDIVLSVTINLEEMLDKKDDIWKKAEKAMSYRHTTQPKGFASAGCTFRNVTPEEAKEANIPNGILSAGYLIDACKLKGSETGNAVISEEHANFILNRGEATASDVKKLIDLAKNKVKEKFGIILHEEIVLIGDFE